MRSKNALKNLIMYFIYEVSIFAVGVIFPRFIILTYGSEVNGLTSTITRILSLINLIQAGAVGAAIFQMYKPVAENDYETQSSIIYTSRKFYNKITILYFSIALIIGILYSLFLKSDIIKPIEIFLSFLILALNGASILWFNSICDIYLSPHQKKYYLIISNIGNLIVNYSLLTCVLLLKLPFIFIYVAILSGGLTSVLLNMLFYKKFSKGFITKEPTNKNYKIPGKTYLMLTSIGSEAVTASPTVIITTFIGLTYSSVFSVYALIFTSAKTILNSIQLSFSAIFGNLVKTSDDDKIYRVHNCIELISIMLGTVFAAGVGFLLIPFIKIYTKGIDDVEYVIPLLAIFVTIYILIFTFRTSFSYVATVYGLFKKICYIVLFFGISGIIISIFCAIVFGMPFVMIGLLYNQLGCSIATLIVLKRDLRWFKIKKLFIRTFVMCLLILASILSYYYFKPEINRWIVWILYGFVCVALTLTILMIYCLIFERKELKLLFSYLINIIKRRKTAKSNEQL